MLFFMYMTTLSKIVPISFDGSTESNRIAGSIADIESVLETLKKNLAPCNPVRTIIICNTSGEEGVLTLPNRNVAQSIEGIEQVKSALRGLQDQLKIDTRGNEGLYRKEIEAINDSICNIYQLCELYLSKFNTPFMQH